MPESLPQKPPKSLNYSSDGKDEKDKRLSPSPAPEGAADERGEGEAFEPYRKGEFPEAFERLCAASLKPVTSLRFKRDCRAAWRRQVESGFSPGQIADAYAAYARDYWLRNGDDAKLAKNLLRWLEGDDGLAAWADEPVAPDVAGRGGEPLGMAELAEADPGFAKLWRKVQARRNVVLSLLVDRNPDATRDDVDRECAGDALYRRYMDACQERYGRYLELHGAGLLGGAPAGRGTTEGREAV